MFDKNQQGVKIEGTIIEYSHYLKCTDFTLRFREVLRYFILRNLVAQELHKERGRWVKKPGKKFTYISPEHKDVHIHINLKRQLLEHLNGLGIDSKRIKYIEAGFDDYKVQAADIQVTDEKQLRDYQEDIVNEVLSPGYRKLINLPTGTGKTFTTLKCAEELGQRTCIMMLPRYKDKWVSDITSTCTNIGDQKSPEDERRYLIIDNKDKLIKLLDTIDEHQDKAIIILTMTTLKSYLKDFQEGKKHSGKPLLPPNEIWNKLMIGFRFTDESHEHFHLNYMIDLFTHMPKTAYLSATMAASSTSPMRHFINTFFPPEERMGSEQYKPYINVIAWRYRHKNPEAWRHVLQGKYSHSEYEQNFIRYKQHGQLRRQYFFMIKEIIDKYYFELRKPGQKAIVFFALVDMCTEFVSFLKEQYPSTDVARYISEDDYNNLMNNEIVVSTPGSAGTAHDIPGLILNVMTLSRRSPWSNFQILGRTREIRDYPGQHPYFVYLTPYDILAADDMHLEKKRLFKGRVLTHDEYDSRVVLDK